jgi:hypothetical protein
MAKLAGDGEKEVWSLYYCLTYKEQGHSVEGYIIRGC